MFRFRRAADLQVIGWLSGLVVSFFTGSAFKHFRKYMTDRSYNKVLGLDRESTCEIIVPSREYCTCPDNPDTPFSAIMAGEATMFPSLLAMVVKHSAISTDKIRLSVSTANRFIGNVIFLIGGPAANIASLQFLAGELWYRFEAPPVRFDSTELGTEEYRRICEKGIDAPDSEGSGGFLHIRSSSDSYERMPFAPESGYILLIKAIVPNGSRIIHLVCGFTQANIIKGIDLYESKELYRHLKKTRHENQFALLLDCDLQSNPDWNHVHDFTEYAFPTIK